jgi:hypothetical protein
MSSEVEPVLPRRTIVRTGAKLAHAAPIVSASMRTQSAGANGVSGLADGADGFLVGRTDDLCGTCCSGS